MSPTLTTASPKRARAAKLVAAMADRVFRAHKSGASERSMPAAAERPVTSNASPASSVPEAGPEWLKFVPADVRGLVRSHLPPGLPDVGTLTGGYAYPRPPATAKAPGVIAPDGAPFLSGTFSNQAGSRPYRLYVPHGYVGQPVPLIVMLHGCTQSPEDFAIGTGMNAVAEEQTCIVVYPGQTTQAHVQKCWKWFSPEDQQRDRGEPALIAGLTRKIMQDYAIDPQRVFVAGLSAGGAAAAIMGETYPELYAAIGVHSGLACGAAHDLASALAVMKRGSGAAPQTRKPGVRTVPAIVFHGDRDTTVSARNGDDVIAQATRGMALSARTETGQVPGGRRFTRTVQTNETGQSVIEQWIVHGSGHGWSGGSNAGSYTDPLGPDATREIMRFFLEHALNS